MSTDVLRDERLAMVELLEGLSEAEWATPSLCEGWTVQDVAAHVAFAPVVRPWELLPAMARSRMNVNRFIGDSARSWAGRGREAIMAQLLSNAESGRGPLGMPHAAVVTDAVVHLSDVGRPLGRHRVVSLPATEVVARFLLGPASRWPASLTMGGSPRGRVAGRRLVADDVEWTWGEGEDLCASAETLLLMLTGRPVDTADR